MKITEAEVEVVEIELIAACSCWLLVSVWIWRFCTYSCKFTSWFGNNNCSRWCCSTNGTLYKVRNGSNCEKEWFEHCVNSGKSAEVWKRVKVVVTCVQRILSRKEKGATGRIIYHRVPRWFKPFPAPFSKSSPRLKSNLWTLYCLHVGVLPDQSEKATEKLPSQDRQSSTFRLQSLNLSPVPHTSGWCLQFSSTDITTPLRRHMRKYIKIDVRWTEVGYCLWK